MAMAPPKARIPSRQTRQSQKMARSPRRRSGSRSPRAASRSCRGCRRPCTGRLAGLCSRCSLGSLCSSCRGAQRPPINPHQEAMPLVFCVACPRAARPKLRQRERRCPPAERSRRRRRRRARPSVLRPPPRPPNLHHRHFANPHSTRSRNCRGRRASMGRRAAKGLWWQTAERHYIGKRRQRPHAPRAKTQHPQPWQAQHRLVTGLGSAKMLKS
mmetsp:Transcript_54332/g.142388  ORF Transcript_54332/g.142388 Transcript_54332/m.142388 type:complete len:214 (+) Transcript_54332:77-718(+)